MTSSTYNSRFKDKDRRGNADRGTVDDEQSNSDDEEKFSTSKFLAAGGGLPTQDGTSPVLIYQQTKNRLIARLYSAVTRAKTTDDYKILPIAYGVVKLHTMRKIKKRCELVVLKFVFKSRIFVDSWIHHEVLRQRYTFHTPRHLSHYNERYYYIESPRTGMDLFGYIDRCPKLKSNRVACAVGRLHKNDVVNRDSKDEIVILDEDGNIRLIDFASVAYIQEGKQYNTFRGTLDYDYAAPETLTGQEYDSPPQDIKKVQVGHCYELFVTTDETDLTAMVQACYIFYQLSNCVLKMQATDGRSPWAIYHLHVLQSSLNPHELINRQRDVRHNYQFECLRRKQRALDYMVTWSPTLSHTVREIPIRLVPIDRFLFHHHHHALPIKQRASKVQEVLQIMVRNCDTSSSDKLHERQIKELNERKSELSLKMSYNGVERTIAKGTG
ncbi:1736_t:CDS:2 [Paraglomus occultum]|uniref:1736_t:CDS:1 n=1 Tax=Paraglomus occultum TaxID=144539 RepID=A0A9N9CU85_9GLOM|nr:1736_t:CDS:2 [Paraglomus occultum]